MTIKTGKNREVILLLDAGGTHARARLVADHGDIMSSPRIVAEESVAVSDKHTLLGFIEDLLRDYTATAAVLSFAGPVYAETVAMTNWRNRDEISMDDLAALGLPAGRTQFINDMEAAALCLIAYKTGVINLDVEPLYTSGPDKGMHFNNAVLIIPGTGVGVAGVILPRPGSAAPGPAHISCELQHTLLPDLGEGYAALVDAMKRRLHKPALTWEDLVSGKGLENLYHCYQAITPDSRAPGAGLSAAEIAGRALDGNDKICVAALECYYHVAGAMTQVVALAFQPFAGVYLAGGTTGQNLPFIRRSSFVKALQDNTIRQGLLRSFPVFLVPEYMNLNGAMYQASRMFR